MSKNTKYEWNTNLSFEDYIQALKKDIQYYENEINLLEAKIDAKKQCLNRFETFIKEKTKNKKDTLK